MSNSLLTNIIELSEIDSIIARVTGEKKKLENDAGKKKKEYLAIVQVAETKKKAFLEKKTAYQKEEKILKEDRNKLADRRKGLGSHNNYKVQQAAEKEMDFTARQLNLKEEALLESIGVYEQLEKEANVAEEKSKAARSELELFLNEAKLTMPNLDDRLQRQTTARQEVLGKIDPKHQIGYERARTRHPMDAVVSLDAQSTCMGCHMNVGPQIVLKVSKGDALIQCPGCLRIVYLSNELRESAEGIA